MECLNLKRIFGERYKVAYEESYYAEYGPNAYREDPWLMVLLCQHGEICPWGGQNLAACPPQERLGGQPAAEAPVHRPQRQPGRRRRDQRGL